MCVRLEFLNETIKVNVDFAMTTTSLAFGKATFFYLRMGLLCLSCVWGSIDLRAEAPTNAPQTNTQRSSRLATIKTSALRTMAYGTSVYRGPPDVEAQVQTENQCALFLLAIPRVLVPFQESFSGDKLSGDKPQNNSVSNDESQDNESQDDEFQNDESQKILYNNAKQLLLKNHNKSYAYLNDLHDEVVQNLTDTLLKPIFTELLIQASGQKRQNIKAFNLQFKPNKKRDQYRRLVARCATSFCMGVGGALLSLEWFDTIGLELPVAGGLAGWWWGPMLVTPAAKRVLFRKNLTFDIGASIFYRNELPYKLRCRLVLQRKKAQHDLIYTPTSVMIQSLDVPFSLSCRPNFKWPNNWPSRKWRGYLSLDAQGDPRTFTDAAQPPFTASVHFDLSSLRSFPL